MSSSARTQILQQNLTNEFDGFIAIFRINSIASLVQSEPRLHLQVGILTRPTCAEQVAPDVIVQRKFRELFRDLKVQSLVTKIIIWVLLGIT